MGRIKIRKENLIWDETNTDHIKKHNVTKQEVETALEDKFKARETHSDRIMIIAKSDTRILSIVLGKDKNGFYPVTARDASKKEREIYRNEKS